MALLDLGLLIERKSISLNFHGYLLKRGLGFPNHSLRLLHSNHTREWSCVLSVLRVN